ncbi:MAG TPA: hypothetical protein PK736_01020 [Bacteroidia bacterium]|nr:hypothetical protein [Bacteroidia bacterium]
MKQKLILLLLLLTTKVHAQNVMISNLNDPNEPSIMIAQQIISNENRDYGKYIERIDLTKLNLPNGTYLLKLEIDDKVEVQRQIKI